MIRGAGQEGRRCRGQAQRGGAEGGRTAEAGGGAAATKNRSVGGQLRLSCRSPEFLDTQPHHTRPTPPRAPLPTRHRPAGNLLVEEQENVKRVQLADEYMSGAALAGSSGSSLPEGYSGMRPKQSLLS